MACWYINSLWVPVHHCIIPYWYIPWYCQDLPNRSLQKNLHNLIAALTFLVAYTDLSHKMVLGLRKSPQLIPKKVPAAMSCQELAEFGCLTVANHYFVGIGEEHYLSWALVNLVALTNLDVVFHSSIVQNLKVHYELVTLALTLYACLWARIVVWRPDMVQHLVSCCLP